MDTFDKDCKDKNLKEKCRSRKKLLQTDGDRNFEIK
jgi:hypothetical protein